MKLIATATLLLTCLLCSCTSEYEERFEEAKSLKQRLLMVEQSNTLTPDEGLSSEIEKIQSEIQFLAKVSGNEDLFLEQIQQN